ncbi:MAG: hypothetical protein Q7T80_14110 [Methanoregula sp.]|nr:hypothetical protein [Methanoregula sp.]
MMEKVWIRRHIIVYDLVNWKGEVYVTIQMSDEIHELRANTNSKIQAHSDIIELLVQRNINAVSYVRSKTLQAHCSMFFPTSAIKKEYLFTSS